MLQSRRRQPPPMRSDRTCVPSQGRTGKAAIVAAAALVLVHLTSISAAAKNQRAIFELTLNQVSHGEAVIVYRPPDVLMKVADLSRAGLHSFAGSRENIDGAEFVSLSSLAPRLTYRVDERALTLEVN